MNPRSRWLLPPTDPTLISALSAALGVPRAVAQILCARGFSTTDSARSFLAPSLGNLHDPFLLRDMDRAVERILRAIRDAEPMEIHGDYDVDGTTSTVILKRAIEMAGGTVGFQIPNRFRDGYGMHASKVEAAAASGVKLIISVDTGIRAAAVVERARELGVDVIVTDHHLPEGVLPPALAVLNPNRTDCSYPDKGLCGVGVAFKLVQALLQSLGWPEEKLRRVLASFLKIVAIGTVADVVPLTGENRVIVRFGLTGLRDVRNPGLRALLNVADFRDGQIPSATQIAFRIAPRINAAGRMEDARDVVELFLTGDETKARSLAEKLHLLNADRQQEEATIVEEVLAACEATPVTDGHAALVFCAPSWHRGVLGIVASRLVERFHRPVFVLSEEGGVAQGSGRSISAFHLLAAMDSMPELFIKYGGHHHAAGLTMDAARVAEFRDRFNECAARQLTSDDFCPTVEIDACLDLIDLHEGTYRDVQRLAPFGNSNPEPLFAVLNAEVAGPPTVWKDKHLKLVLRQERRTLFFKGFGLAHRAEELRTGMRVDVAFNLADDPWSGGWSALLRDFREAGFARSAISSPAPESCEAV
ncbi:MAG TPA: single-stranded-DNA-specific exonuclease RecJ [Bryobacteraceae bacterium]